MLCARAGRQARPPAAAPSMTGRCATRRTARARTRSERCADPGRRRTAVRPPVAANGSPTWLRMFSSTICWDCRSMMIWQPDGRNGKPRSMSRSQSAPGQPGQRAEPMVEPELLRWCPTKSRTVKTALSRVRRSPRPSCCRNRVALSVGRSNSTVSTSGRSRPSLNRSAANRAFTRRSRRSLQGRGALGRRGRPADRQRRDTGLAEGLGHEFGVSHADAEAESAHARRGRAPCRAVARARSRPELGCRCTGCPARRRRSGRGAQRDCCAGRCRPRSRSSGTGRAGPRRGRPTAGARRRSDPRRSSRTSMPSVRSGVAVRPSSSCGRQMLEQPPVGRGFGVVELVDHDHVVGVRRRCWSTPYEVNDWTLAKTWCQRSGRAPPT